MPELQNIVEIRNSLSAQSVIQQEWELFTGYKITIIPDTYCKGLNFISLLYIMKVIYAAMTSQL